MTLLEAIESRHSVRRYKNIPLTKETVKILLQKIEEINRKGELHIQLIMNEPKAFKGIFAYGRFSGVNNYFVVSGKKADDLDERAGYYGEQLVLLAQQLGLNTCWVGQSYRKIENTFKLDDGEKVVCYIAVGYGETQGAEHKHKTLEDVSNITRLTPEWFKKGVTAALLAPTAVNQQKFYFEYVLSDEENQKPKVKAKKLFSLVGYTNVDLGIAKYHFEIAAGTENFVWE